MNMVRFEDMDEAWRLLILSEVANVKDISHTFVVLEWTLVPRLN